MAYFKPITFPVTDKVTKQTQGCGLIKQLPKKNYNPWHDKTALCLLAITTNLPQQLLSFGYTSSYPSLKVLLRWFSETKNILLCLFQFTYVISTKITGQWPKKQGNVFLLHQRSHANIQAVLVKNKKIDRRQLLYFQHFNLFIRHHIPQDLVTCVVQKWKVDSIMEKLILLFIVTTYNNETVYITFVYLMIDSFCDNFTWLLILLVWGNLNNMYRLPYLYRSCGLIGFLGMLWMSGDLSTAESLMLLLGSDVFLHFHTHTNSLPQSLRGRSSPTPVSHYSLTGHMIYNYIPTHFE